MTLPIIVGSIPGAWLGAQLSSRAAGGVVRRALALVLLASGLKMLGTSSVVTLWALAAALCGGTVAWGVVRYRHGFSFFAWQDRRKDREASR